VLNPDTDKQINLYALIDTGADECAFPASFAPLLGHNLQAGHLKKISTGNGITIAYGHTARIVIEGFSTQDVLVDFMPNLHVPSARCKKLP
jgi:predicted aspartyl protease